MKPIPEKKWHLHLRNQCCCHRPHIPLNVSSGLVMHHLASNSLSTLIWIPIFLASFLSHPLFGMYSERAAENGEYPSAVAILNDGVVVSVGVLVTHMHVFTICSVVGELIELSNSTYNETDYLDDDYEAPESDDFLQGFDFRGRNAPSSYNFRPYSVDLITLVAGSKWMYELEAGQSRTVGNSYAHPDCGKKVEDSLIRQAILQLGHNVGVFEARSGFFFTPNLKPISLWSDSESGWISQLQYLEKNEIKCSVAGWGKTKTENYSEWLLVADVKVVPAEYCMQQFCGLSSQLCEYLMTNFRSDGKLCVANLGAAHPCDNDVGTALYCDDFAYGLLSRIYNCSPQSLLIFDSVHRSIDLYYTVQLEASAATSLLSIDLLVTTAIGLLSASFYVLIT